MIDFNIKINLGVVKTFKLTSYFDISVFESLGTKSCWQEVLAKFNVVHLLALCLEELLVVE